MKKRVLVLLLCVVLAIFLQGCKSNKEPAKQPGDASPSATQSQGTADADDGLSMRAKFRTLFDTHVQDPEEYGYVSFYNSQVNETDYLIIFSDITVDVTKKALLVKNDDTELAFDFTEFIREIESDKDSQTLTIQANATMEEIIVVHTYYKNLFASGDTEREETYYRYDISGDTPKLVSTDTKAPERYDFDIELTSGIVKNDENEIETYLGSHFARS